MTVTSTTISIGTAVNVGDGSRIVGSAGPPGQLTASGATAPITWAIVAGTLPPGLNIDNTGRFSGTPQARGTALVTVRAVDSSSPALFADGAVSLVIS